MMDVKKRIEQLMKLRGLTYYKLAKCSGLSPSTLSNMQTRGTTPSLYTLEQICLGLQITLSQFFMDESDTGYCHTDQQKELLKYFVLLTPEQQVLILQLVKNLLGNAGEKNVT